MFASNCAMGTRWVRRVEEKVEDIEREKVTVTGEAAGMRERPPFSRGGVRGGETVKSLSARYHPRVLLV